MNNKKIIIYLCVLALSTIIGYGSKAASIYSIDPKYVVPGETIVTIKGEGFGNSSSNKYLYFGYSPVTAQSWSNTEIKVKAPYSIPSTGEIEMFGTFTNSSGSTEFQDLKISYYLKPVIQKVSPTSAQAGERIVITGNSFGTQQGTVKFGDKRANILSWSDGSIIVDVPVDPGRIITVYAGNAVSDSYDFNILTGSSSDAYSAKQTYLFMANIEAAWKLQKNGSTDIVVAVIDDGVYLNHTDLREALWRNYSDAIGDKIDNDKNGFIDDYYGWNFVDRNNDMTTKGSHGTQVAGLIGAIRDNNIGIAGVASGVKIMPIIVCDESGCGQKDIIDGIQYAINMGADIINLSLGNYGSLGYADAFNAIIKKAYDQGIIVVASAGNGDPEGGIGQNLDFIKASPVCNDGDYNYVLGVGATDKSNKVAYWSAYGKCVDVFAPGEEIISTTVAAESGGYGYESSDGTSFSAPIVSGVAALIKSKYPNIKNYEVYDRIISSGDLDHKIDASKAISATSNDILRPKIISLSVKSAGTGQAVKLYGEHFNNNITLTFTGPEMIKIMAGGNIKILNSNTAEVTITPDFKDGLYSIKISVGSFDHNTLSNVLTIKKIAVTSITEPVQENGVLSNIDTTLSNRLKGKLLLQVEQGGRIWYVNPGDTKRYEVTFANALPLFQKFALGITNANLNKIPLNTETKTTTLGNQQRGKLLLQVEDRGRIWYVDFNGRRWEVTWANLMKLFESLALGITNADLNKIQEGSF